MGKSIGAGLSVNGVGSTGIGAGIMFGSLIYTIGRQRGMYDRLFTLGLMSFALLESFALFSLLVCFLLMFS